jgi:predicted oxidoreductase
MEPEEVAKAFDELKFSGKVRHFGVSNQNPYQMQLLQSCLDMPLCVNQLQFSVMHAPMIQSGINVNMYNDSATNRDGGILDFCRLNKITIQPWSPMQYGFFEGCFVDNEKFPELNKTLGEIAEKYGVSKTTIAFAWILRHPAFKQVVTGTTSPERMADLCKATDITMSHEDWYALYLATGKTLP